MNSLKPFTCIIIGEDYLTIQCAELLIANEFKIEGIVSSYSKASSWLKTNQIPFYDSVPQFEIEFKNKNVDYLFSVVNSKILSASTIGIARHLAINYHHSLLPRYAGTNAPSWAILQKEKQHGITWHLMTSTIDQGDILKQIQFNISTDETALTLNHKCYKYAIALFSELLKDIKSNNVTSIKQNNQERSYYGLVKKPLGNGLINWHSSAQDIEQTFRALYLGIYDNSLSVLKLHMETKGYIVLELKVSENLSTSPPGTICELNTTFLRVATQTHDILIIKIANLYGQELNLRDFACAYALKTNHFLFKITKKELSLFELLSSEMTRYEQFWLAKLTTFEPAEMPYIGHVQNNYNNTYDVISSQQFPITLLQDLSKALDINDLHTILLTFWLIYLHRIGNKKNLGIAINAHLNSELGIFKDYFSNQLPFFIQLNDNHSFLQAFKSVDKQLALQKEKKTYLKDVFYRYQALSTVSPLIAIGVVFEDTTPIAINEFNSTLILKISKQTNSIKWYLKKYNDSERTMLSQFIQNSAQHLIMLIKSAHDNITQPIKLLPLLTSEERVRLLKDNNNTQQPYPKNKNVNKLLEPSFIKFQQNIAIQTETTSYTYEVLNSKIEQIRTHMKHYNIDQRPIVVYLDRSLEWIISVLAIIRSGGIYVPITDKTPIKRIELIIADSKPSLILTKTAIIPRLKEIDTYSCPILDISLAINTSNQSPPLQADVAPNDPAYILYTSGTTGHPKGVIIRHFSLNNLIHEQINALSLDSTSKVLQFSSIAFDASIWEIFSTFYSGAALCLPSDDGVLIGKELSNKINFFNASHITLPPSILQTINKKNHNSLRVITTAGEACSKELAEKWMHHVTLLNAYGPTETTVCATIGLIKDSNIISIGKPIANTQIYILDENYQPVPEGVTGELYIAGDALAEGYLNQPTLTQKYFINNPLTETEGKVYRTRDVARWLFSGTLEYIGRIDNQIKIRGLRIEPEAIETQILHFPNILQCAVALRHNNTNEKFIVAYIVPCSNIDLHKLREFLSEHLPHYMIPNFFITLDSLPLTINGKIDRNALPLPQFSNNLGQSDLSPPQSLIEHKLCNIWIELLGVERVGIHDDFFTIGGNSLLLSQFIIILREQFYFEMHISSILKNPTIAAIANLVTKTFQGVIDDDYNHRFISETILPSNMHPALQKSKKAGKTILLTGASGFIGAHLLEQLCIDQHTTIYCLMRAKSTIEATELLRERIANQGVVLSFTKRIIALPGDISLPNLGINSEIYHFLAEEIDTIIHNAASVHHIYSYERLKHANVHSTIQILKLASLYRHKTIHFMSTLSAMNLFIDKDYNVIEDFLPTGALPPATNGYNQSKWVSERLLSEAANQGYTVNIYRPGWILGSTKKPMPLIPNNHLLTLIKGCVQLGIAPNLNIDFDITPIDFFTRIISQIILTNQFQNRVFNFSNTNRVSWLSIISFLNSHQYNIKLVTQEKWLNSLDNIDEDNALFNLLSLYIDTDLESNFKHPNCQTKNVEEILKVNRELYPLIDETTLTNLLYHLINEQGR